MAKNSTTLTIKLVADGAKSIGRQFQQLGRDIKKTDGVVGKAKKSIGGSFALIRANAVAFGAVAGAAMFKFAKDSVDAASNLEQSIGGVEKAFGSAAEEVLAIGENAAESMGLSQRAFNEGALALSAFAEDIANDTGKPVAAVIEELMTRAADFAAAYGTTVPEAVRVFSSTLSGESEPAKKFGIIINETETKAYAAAAGVEDLSKTTQRAGLLMKDTAKFAGQFADESDTLAGTQERLGATVENLQARIGNELLPTVAEGAGVILDMAQAMEKLQFDIGGVNEKLDENRGFWGNVANATQNALNPARQAGQAFNELKYRVEEAWHAFDEADGAIKNTTFSIQGGAQSAEYLKDATEEATAAQKDATSEDKKRADAVAKVTSKLNDAYDAQQQLTDAVLESGDASLAYRNQQARTAEIIRDSAAATEDLDQAARDAEGAAYDQAAAAVELAVKQAEMNRVTLTAEDRARIYREELIGLAGYMTGPARQAILDHINTLRQIPTTIRTNVVTNYTRGGSFQSSQAGVVGAEGGIVNRPTYALIGEAGPEAVIPLDRSPGNEPLPRGRGGRGGGTVINNYPAGTRPVDVVNGNRTYLRTQGTTD